MRLLTPIIVLLVFGLSPGLTYSQDQPDLPAAQSASSGMSESDPLGQSAQLLLRSARFCELSLAQSPEQMATQKALIERLQAKFSDINAALMDEAPVLSRVSDTMMSFLSFMLARTHSVGVRANFYNSLVEELDTLGLFRDEPTAVQSHAIVHSLEKARGDAQATLTARERKPALSNEERLRAQRLLSRIYLGTDPARRIDRIFVSDPSDENLDRMIERMRDLPWIRKYPSYEPTRLDYYRTFVYAVYPDRLRSLDVVYESLSELEALLTYASIP